MKREERVKRYMEILNKNEKNNCVKNWEIFDKLSEDELSIVTNELLEVSSS